MIFAKRAETQIIKEAFDKIVNDWQKKHDDVLVVYQYKHCELPGDPPKNYLRVIFIMKSPSKGAVQGSLYFDESEEYVEKAKIKIPRHLDGLHWPLKEVDIS